MTRPSDYTAPGVLHHPSSDRVELTGERRTITSLFYDIVNSTALLNLGDPEDFNEAQVVIHRQVRAAIIAQGGYMGPVQGDGGLAFFGYPVPHEDAPSCAVAAALDALQRCRSSRIAIKGQDIGIRFGIATGVVLLNPPDAENSTETQFVGLALNLAARLQAEADPNSIAVAESTYELTKSAFEYELIGTKILKGFAGPERLWRPLRHREAADRFTAYRSPATPFVSRVAEVEQCRNLWQQAMDGTGRGIVIVGEPGVGKSRLVAELCRRMEFDASAIRTYQCQPRGNSRPLHPFVDRLQRELRKSGYDGASTSMQNIKAYLDAASPQHKSESVEAVEFLLNYIPAEKAASESGLEFLPDSDFAEKAVNAILDLLSAACRVHPQVIIVEDYHWADTLTQYVVEKLVAEVPKLPLLLILTSRDADHLSHLVGDHVQGIDLAPLDRASVREMVSNLGGPAENEALVSLIFQRSDGIPLFIEEFVRLLQGQLGDGSPVNQTVVERILRSHHITTLNDLLAARLAAAGQARRIAQIASIFGREFTLQSLAAVCDGIVTASVLTDGIDRLQRLGIIEAKALDPKESLFSFRHALLQEAAYDSMLRADRAALHDRIVRAVLGGRLASMPGEIMAWHCEKSGRHFEAAQFALEAAEACAERSALREAEQLLSFAEEQLGICGAEMPVRDALLQILTLRGTIATALYGTGSREARSIYERGVAVCREGKVENPERWFPLYWGWWFTSPDFDTRRGRSQIIVRDLGHARDPEIRLQGFHCAWAANFHSGNHHACLDCIQHGLELYDHERAIVSRVRYGGHDAKVCALGERAQSLWFIGEVDAAAESAMAAVRWADEIAHVGSMCHAIDTAMLHGFYCRDRLAVASFSERLRVIGQEHGLAGAIAKSQIFGGWCLATTSVDEGLCLIRDGLRVQQEIGTEEDLPIYLDMLAELLEMTGDTGAALATLDQAIKRSLATADAFWLAELYRRRAVLKWTAHLDPHEIEADLSASARMADAQHSRAIAKRIQDSRALIAISAEGH